MLDLILHSDHRLSLDADWSEALGSGRRECAAGENPAYRGYFDGASRGNPGEAGAGALLVDEQGDEVWRCALALGKRTNNEAEYDALLILLEEIQARGLFGVAIHGDSKLVVNQVSGLWKIKEPRLRALAERSVSLLQSTESTLTWIPREENVQADRLSNEALDGPVKKEEGIDAFFPSERLERITAYIYIAHGTEDYAVDLLHKACTCPSFQFKKRCKHLEAARRLAT